MLNLIKQENIVIKKIFASSLFVISWSISAMEGGFIELDCSKEGYQCQGRYYTKETDSNAVSPCNQRVWTFQDPIMNDCSVSEDPLQDPLNKYEYNALVVHTCSIMCKVEMFFSNMLITKIEVNSKNQHPRRALQTFFSQSFSGIGDKIYAWVNLGSQLHELLIKDYCFTSSWQPFFIPHTETKVPYPPSTIIQLEARKSSIREIFCRPNQNHKTNTIASLRDLYSADGLIPYSQ